MANKKVKKVNQTLKLKKKSSNNIKQIKSNLCQIKKCKINKKSTDNKEETQSLMTNILPVSQTKNFSKVKKLETSFIATNMRKKELTKNKLREKFSKDESEDKDEIIKLLKERITQLERKKCSRCGEKSHRNDTESTDSELHETDKHYDENDVLNKGNDSHDHHVNQLTISNPCSSSKNILDEILILDDISKEDPYSKSCESCLFTYKTKQEFTKHQSKCRMKISSVLQKCLNCDRKFRNDKLYLSHLKRCDRYKKLKELATNIHLKEDNSHTNYFDDLSDMFPKAYTQSKVLEIENYHCYNCSTMYYSKTSFLKHKKYNVCGNMSKRILCTYEDCNIKFTRYEHFLLHLPSYHDDVTYLSQVKYFTSFSSFEDWRAHEQNKTLSYLIKSRGSKKYKSTEYSYYECQFNTVCDGKRGGKRKTERRKKAGVLDYVFCPARMTVIRDIVTDVLCVNYIEKHSHELTAESVIHQRFPKTITNQIMNKLKMGNTPFEILEFYANDVSKPNSSHELKMTNMISLQFIKGLKRKLSQQDQCIKGNEIVEIDNELDKLYKVKVKEEKDVVNLDGSENAVEEYYEVKFEDDNETINLKLINTEDMVSKIMAPKEPITYEISDRNENNTINLVCNPTLEKSSIKSTEITNYVFPIEERADNLDSKIIEFVIVETENQNNY